MEKFATDTAPNGPHPPAGGGCGCTGGRRRRHRHTRKGGVGMVDDAVFAVGTSYAADRWGRKKTLGARRRRLTKKRGGAGLVDDAIVAGSALTLAHYFAKKRGGKKHLPRRLTKKTLV